MSPFNECCYIVNADRLQIQKRAPLPNLRPVCSLWIGRHRAEATAIVEDGREAYQNAVDRLAEIKCSENLFLLQKAKVKQLAARDHIVCCLLRGAGNPLTSATSVHPKKMNTLCPTGRWDDDHRSSQIPENPAATAAPLGDHRGGCRSSRGSHHHLAEQGMPAPYPHWRPSAGEESTHSRSLAPAPQHSNSKGPMCAMQ